MDSLRSSPRSSWHRKVVARYTDQSEKWLSPASEGNFLVNQEQLGNALALAEGNPNLYFENPGTFTFKVAEDLSSLVINGQFEEQPEPDKAYYLTGSFNNWNQSEEDEVIAFELQEDGSFKVERSLEAGAEFKIKDEKGTWLGGDTQGQSDLFELKADFNVVELSDSEGAKNFVINQAGDYTFAIKDGYLTVTGWSEQPGSRARRPTTGPSRSSSNSRLARTDRVCPSGRPARLRFPMPSSSRL